MNAFQTFAESFSQHFNHYLAENIFPIISAIPSCDLAEAMIHSLSSNGKRLRPALLYLCSQTPIENLGKFDQRQSVVFKLATAIEVFHTYTLIHDDLPAMDNADFRRDKPSCHKKYSEWLAILAGDAFNTLAFEQLAEIVRIDPQEIHRLPIYLQILASHGGMAGLVSGQAQDMFSQKKRPPLKKWERKKNYELKTGSLFACSCSFGAIFADTKNITAYLHWGYRLGYYYQLLNDLLDCPQDTDSHKMSTDQQKERIFRIKKALAKEVEQLPLFSSQQGSKKDSRLLLVSMLDYWLSLVPNRGC